VDGVSLIVVVKQVPRVVFSMEYNSFSVLHRLKFHPNGGYGNTVDLSSPCPIYSVPLK